MDNGVGVADLRRRGRHTATGGRDRRRASGSRGRGRPTPRRRPPRGCRVRARRRCRPGRCRAPSSVKASLRRTTTSSSVPPRRRPPRRRTARGCRRTSRSCRRRGRRASESVAGPPAVLLPLSSPPRWPLIAPSPRHVRALAQRLVDGGDERPRLRQRLVVLALGSESWTIPAPTRRWYSSSKRTSVRMTMFSTARSSKPTADAAGVRSAPGGLDLVDYLHRPGFRRAGNGAAREHRAMASCRDAPSRSRPSTTETRCITSE